MSAVTTEDECKGVRDMARGGGSRRSAALGGVAFLGALVVILVAGYFIGNYLEQDGVREERAVMSEGFGRYEETISLGKTYYKKTNITTLLFMGIDRDTSKDDSNRISFRNGGQSDFLLLMVIDHENNTIRQLQIERDTMAKVDVLTVLGAYGGTRTLQICLSHGYGADQTACAENTVNAVSRYLNGTTIDLYMALDYSAVDILNDLLGGVTVTLTEDFSDLDPEMTAGKTLTLHGHQAELFVRSRMSVGDGTNASRQLRQRAWMSGAVNLLRARMKEDTSFFEEILDTLGNRLTTNVSQGRLINEFNQAWDYEMLPVEQIKGEYKIGSDGYMEYHTDQEDVTAWVLDAFYRAADESGREETENREASGMPAGDTDRSEKSYLNIRNIRKESENG